MKRIVLLAILLAALASTPAPADPGIKVSYRDGLLGVILEGTYSGVYYQVSRSGVSAGPYDPLTFQRTLCTGDCFLTDPQVVPGQTYYYRFELLDPRGSIIRFGPYAVTIPDTPIGVRAIPNPSADVARIDLALPGSNRMDAPLPVEAQVLDLQGRTVRVLVSGLLPRGVTSLAWDGRADSGRPLGAGIYFVRVATPLGIATTRIIRVR